MLKDDNPDQMKEKLAEASRVIKELQEDLELRDRLDNMRNSAYAPGINDEYDPLEHAF